MREPVELRRVRVRHAAGRHFADLVVGVAPDKGVGQAHATADEIEDLVARALGNADVVVHVEPVAPEGGLRERATAAAATVPEVREVHNVRVMRVATYTSDVISLRLASGLPAIGPFNAEGLPSAHDAIAAALMRPVGLDRRHLVIALTNGAALAGTAEAGRGSYLCAGSARICRSARATPSVTITLSARHRTLRRGQHTTSWSTCRSCSA